MAGYGYGRTNHNPYATPPRTEPSTAWTYHAGAAVVDLVVAGETVYVRTKAALVALDANDGSERWRRSRAAEGTLAFIANRLYDTDRKRVRALEPTGTELWTTDLDGWCDSVLERDGWVYVLTDRHVVRLHADTGDVVSKLPLAAYALTTMGGPLYAGMFTMFAYDVVGGEFDARWSVEFEEDYRPYGPVTATSGRLFRGERVIPASDAPTGRLSVYDAADGSVQTRIFSGRTLQPPAVDGGSAYVSTTDLSPNHLGEDGRFVAYSLDGDPRWIYQPDASLQRPIVANGAVYLGPFANRDVPLIAFDARTGDELWRKPIDLSPELAVAGDTLYVATRDRVRALHERS